MIFQNVKWLSFIAAVVKDVKNVPEDLLGQTGKGVGVFEFLGFDPCRCKLGLDEAEPDVRFLLIVGTKFDL
jgi:hypothetical protein